GDPQGVYEIGLEHASRQSADLFDHGIAGIHYYTLDQAEPTLEILTRIGREKAICEEEHKKEPESRLAVSSCL
ncbi:MAG: methylenetetrahydrofolate reductase, partial [Verrucomicrobiota bacterium]